MLCFSVPDFLILLIIENAGKGIYNIADDIGEDLYAQ